MARRNDIAPPGIHPRKGRKRKTVRFFIHLLVWSGVAILYYVVFSLLFDTPAEHAMKNSTQRLRDEYATLTQRYDSLEMVLDNIVERDGNVFRIMFESEPYNLQDDMTEELALRGDMEGKSQEEMSVELLRRAGMIEQRAASMEQSLEGLVSQLDDSAARLARIPSIQPVINRELTLLTASYGMRIHPFYKTLSSHMGVDYTVPEGSRVFATADGRVKEIVRRTGTSGLSVVIDHGNGYETSYSHLSRINVNLRQQVRRGDIIAWSGNSGLSLAPHLHYEVRLNGMRVDPIHYFFMELSPADYRKIIRIASSGMQSFD